MTASALGLAVLIGTLLWSWGLAAQGSNVQNPFVRAFLVNVVTIIGLLPFLPGRMSAWGFTSKDGWLLLLAGLMNFGGHALFPQLQTMAGSHISTYMPIIIGCNIIVLAVGGVLIYGDPMTLPKMISLLLILTGVAGLTLFTK
jgi:multidrug transporter EmrE-like cation transporter